MGVNGNRTPEIHICIKKKESQGESNNVNYLFKKMLASFLGAAQCVKSWNSISSFCIVYIEITINII